MCVFKKSGQAKEPQTITKKTAERSERVSRPAKGGDD